MKQKDPQGNPKSGLIFSVLRADALDELRQENNRVMILSFHDDDYILGEPNDIFQTVLSLDEKMQPLVLSRNNAKCKIYDQSGLHDDLETQCNNFGGIYVPAEEEVSVCGAPVSCVSFQRVYQQ